MQRSILLAGVLAFAATAGRLDIHGRDEESRFTGRTGTKEEMLHDVITMKRMNVNAVRTCRRHRAVRDSP